MRKAIIILGIFLMAASVSAIDPCFFAAVNYCSRNTDNPSQYQACMTEYLDECELQ